MRHDHYTKSGSIAVLAWWSRIQYPSMACTGTCNKDRDAFKYHEITSSNVLHCTRNPEPEPIIGYKDSNFLLFSILRFMSLISFSLNGRHQRFQLRFSFKPSLLKPHKYCKSSIWFTNKQKSQTTKLKLCFNLNFSAR